MARITVAEVSGYCDRLDTRLATVEGETKDLWAAVERLTTELHTSRETEARLTEQLSYTRARLDQFLDAERTREREAADLRQEHALVRQQLADHLKRTDESDRRLWTLFGLAVAAILAFAGNFALSWVRK